MIAGLRRAGDQFEQGEIFVPELMWAAEAFKEAMVVLDPAMRDKPRQYVAKIVLGSVRGDVHDIGKNLVAMMLESVGLEVIDLGINVPPEAFVAAVTKHRPQLVGLSALLTTTMLEMGPTIEALKAAGLRDDVKVLVGGAPASERFADSIGADAYAKNAAGAIKKALELLKE